MYGIVWCSSCWHGKDDGHMSHMSLESPSKGPHRDTHPSHESERPKSGQASTKRLVDIEMIGWDQRWGRHRA